MRLLTFLLAISFFFSPDAFAIGGKFFNRGGNFRGNVYSNQTQMVRPAAPAQQGLVERETPQRPRFLHPIVPQLRTTVEFNYRVAYENPQPDRAIVVLNVREDFTKALAKGSYVYVTYFELKHSNKTRETSQFIEIVDPNTIKFVVPDLASENIYRMDFSFWSPGEERAHEVFKAEKYYAVTSGESLRSKATHQIVTLALVEAHDWKVGRTGHGNARYNLSYGNGWCGIFQRDFFERFTRAYDYTGNDEPSNGFKHHSEYVNGKSLPDFAAAGPVHGFYGYRDGGHKFMILGYSLDTGVLYSLDGNFGNRVAIVEKGLDQLTAFGVVNDALAWEENLTVFPGASSRTAADLDAEVKKAKEEQAAAEKAEAAKKDL
ncbi:hypothetical protein K2X33_03850 [bacterium]|nr:hypothetical protein [bacterium]